MEPTREQLAALARQLDATAPEEIDCEAVLERVAAYVDTLEPGMSPAPELDKVRQHLSVCPACLEEFNALMRAIEA